MSTTSEYDPAARQDYGPTTSSENFYHSVLEHKLADNMSSIRTPVLRAVPVSVSEVNPEPDSTAPENVIHTKSNVDKEVEYHIAEKSTDVDMSMDTLSGIVRIEKTTFDDVGHIAYPIIHESNELCEGNYVENPTSNLLQAPINSAIVQNVTKLPQNFTINVDTSNITTLQNVSQDVGNQTLWLPTILATSAAAPDINAEDATTLPGVSQIIITSESYVSDINQAGRRANIITETNYMGRPKTSKVQILSNIQLSKNQNYSQQYLGSSQGKEIEGVYKLNTMPQKHVNSSVLCTKPLKSQSMVGCSSSISQTVVNNTPIKNVSYTHAFTKSSGLSKTLNKVNNGDNLSTVVAASSGNTQCHILSRVVSGPNKMSVHSGRKSVSAIKKNSGQVSQKNQSKAIKIIQQAGSVNKSEAKSWPVTYGVVDTSTSKVIQKVGSPTNKSQPMSLQKLTTKGERLVLQSPCGPVLLSTAPICTSLPKGPHYVQSGSTTNLHYVQAYRTTDHQLSSVSQVSANQQLTAQILQSLSQPKLMLQSGINMSQTLTPILNENEIVEAKPIHQKRIVFGDKSTLLTANDVIGMEERPNLSEQLRQYSFQPLAIVMLDHTYALPAQKKPLSTPPIISTSPPLPAIISSPIHTISPISPLKTSPPAILQTPSYELPITIAQTVVGPVVPVTTITMGALTYKPQTLPIPQDDDAASNISSLDGDKREERGGSDTETAPEGEEEGKTRCICDFTHDDGYMICCDRCSEWQHVDCMGIDRQNIPDAYMCELCHPRPIDRRHARAIQMRKREELSALAGSDTDSSEAGPGRQPGQRRKRLVTVTTYTNTSGSCVTTYNSNLPVLPPLPQPSLALPKRGPKRPKKAEIVANTRKVTKRKLSEKRVKRKKELMLNRSKCNATPSTQSHWQDSYELAMTNHYSPELRAKIMKYSSKLGNTPNMASAITAHLCTTVPHAGGKILIATKDLKENTPVIELRGKYMLSNQHRPQLQTSARAGSQKPGPFVFFYRLPKDNTQICIDTRTYGNEARFVRRSCKPNAELQHCIVKGTLHVYLVTIGPIQSNTEITVGHDSNGSKQPCACGNPKHCKVNGLHPLLSRKSIDWAMNPREKRSRNRCASLSSPVSPPLASPLTSPTKEHATLFSPIKYEKRSPIKAESPMMSPIKNVTTFNLDALIKNETVAETKPYIDLLAKEEMKPEIDEPDFVSHENSYIQLKKFVIEEKMPQPEEPKEEILEPVTINFEGFNEENMENEIPLKPIQEKPAIEERIVEEENTLIKEEKPQNDDENLFIKVEKPVPKEEKPIIKEEEPLITEEKPLIKEEKPLIKEEKPLIKEEKSLMKDGTAKSACHDRSSRTSRSASNNVVNPDNIDDKTDDSQDKIQTPSNNKEKDKRKMTREERKMEAIMKAFERLEKAQQRKQEVKERQKRRESDPHPNTTDKDEDEDTHCITKKRRRRRGRARTTSQSNRRRLDSADSDMVTSGDEAPHATLTPPRALPSRRDSTLPNDSERVNETVSEDLGVSSACLLVEAAVGSVESAFKLPKTKKTMANEWVGRSPDRTPSPYQSPYRPSCLVPNPSLESLVRVASTMIGDLSGAQDLGGAQDPSGAQDFSGAQDLSGAQNLSRAQNFNGAPFGRNLSGAPDMEHVDGNHNISPPRTPTRDRSRPPKKAKRITRSTLPIDVPEVVQPSITQHSAKKRWLRQAISEESDSPIADTFVPESPPNEMITPLKKRRFARESISYEQNNIVHCQEDTSPNLTSEDSPVKEDNSKYQIPMYGRDRTRSDSGQGSDDQCHMDNDVLNLNIKGPHDSEHIRRIIGVPMPDDDAIPVITIADDDIKTNNNNIETDENNYNKVVPMEIDTTILPQPKIESNENSNSGIKIDSPTDKLNCQSADTSGNSSPQRNEMDDIQKKIHSFHTENIQILKSRNKKPPKEKRKKVNLNFDLNMVDDQISIQLRTEDTDSKSPEINGDHDDVGNSVHEDAKIYVSPENIPLPPIESIPLPAPILPETIPLPEDPVPMLIVPPPETIPLPEEPLQPALRRPLTPTSPENTESQISEPQVESTLPFSSRFSSTGLFSGIFMSQSQCFDNNINENVPNMSIIKSAIDRTTILDNSLFEKDNVDELQSVQEILTRVNNMDSNNSLLLSGVLKSSNNTCAAAAPAPAAKPYWPRNSDPRLNPPPADKPKPVRRKLSISEYRKRQASGAGGLCGEESGGGEAGGREGAEAPEWSSESSGAGVSPPRDAAEDVELRLHREIAVPTPKGVFDAQPTASERQRENLSSRLRREFGLALAEDEEARHATEKLEAASTQHCDR